MNHDVDGHDTGCGNVMKIISFILKIEFNIIKSIILYYTNIKPIYIYIQYINKKEITI